MIRRRNWKRSRFDAPEQDPLAAMSNLVDIMLVFACGLIAALAAQRTLPEGSSQGLPQQGGGEEIVEGREMPQLPAGAGQLGSGYEAVGQVYRDSKTGKMILIGADQDDHR